jgi:hypothetical protein
MIKKLLCYFYPIALHLFVPPFILACYRSKVRCLICIGKFLSPSLPNEPMAQVNKKLPFDKLLGFFHMDVLMTCGDCWCHVPSMYAERTMAQVNKKLPSNKLLGFFHMDVLMTCGDCWCHVPSIYLIKVQGCLSIISNWIS